MKVTEITVKRTIPAPPEQVFDVWMDPQSPGGPWFGSARLILNPVVDGLFYFVVDFENHAWPHFGRFVQIQRPRLVEYTWMSEATKGLESVVSVSFTARDGQTEVVLRHSGVPDDDMGRQHQEGWTWVLSMLAERFASAHTAPAPARPA